MLYHASTRPVVVISTRKACYVGEWKWKARCIAGFGWLGGTHLSRLRRDAIPTLIMP